MVEVGNVAVGAVVVTYVLAHVVYALSTIFTVFGGKLFGLRNVEHMIFPHVPVFLFQLISGLVSLCASMTWAVAVVFFSLIPFVVLCFFLTLVHMNHARIAAFVVSTYNEHIGGSDTLQFFRHGLWLLKLAGESLVPVYNLLVSAITGGTYEILNVLVGNIRMQESMTSLVLGLGQLMRTIMAAGAQWVTRNWSECAQTPALVAEIVASEDTHRCLENGPGLYRALDLSVVAGDMATVVERAVSVFVRVCPAVQAAVLVLVHPLLDSNIVLFVENMANALVTAAYTAWDVTHLRCRAVQLLPTGNPRARTSLCVPDVAPVFLFASEASSALGRLVDNWATRAMRYALSFFFVPDGTETETCAAVYRDADVADLTAGFAPDASTRVLAVTDKLTAGTDGTSVVFHEALSNATYASAFAHPVDLRAGLAPVALLPDPRFADLDGNTQTAVMGCRCDATAGVRIRCEIAPFSTSPLLEGDVAATTVELSFESETTNDFFASCADLSISVQPLRFPARSMPPDTAQRLFYGAGGADASATACVRDPRACSTVDAAVYVMPLCRGTNIEAHTRCIEGLDQMRCFPYCVGLHQRNAGTKPIILHSYDLLRSGVFLTNTNCAPALATAQTTSTALPLLADSLYADLSAAGRLDTTRRTLAPTDPIDAARDYDCILRPAAARSSAARDAAQARAPRARLFAETTSPSEFQPVVFAGDTVLTPFCNEYSGAGGATWSCDWSVNLERVTSALNNRYAIADVRTRVPASRELPPQQSQTLPLPGRHAASLAGLQVSAQLPDGVVYGINPYYDEFRCLITSTPCFGVTSGRLESPALFVARPHLQCSSTPEVMLQHTTAERVLLCAGDMARRVTWDDAGDGFVDEAALARQDVRTYKLYIEHVSYYNAHNVLVAVRRGPARELKYELGYDTRPSAYASACHTAFYFVDTETLRAVRGQPWRSASEYHAQAFDREIGCLQDPLLPPLGMLGARASQVAITAARVLGNSFVLNGVGLVEELLTQQPAAEGLDAQAVPLRLCHNAFGHGAFEPCSVLPLSVSPIHASVVRLFAHWRLVVRRFVVYVQVLTGFGFGPGQWFENLLVAGAEPDASVLQAATEGVAAAGAVSFGAVLGVLSSSVHVSFYVVEDIGLAYVRAALRYMRTRQIREVFLVDLSLMFPGTVYNSLHNNAYDNMVRAPGLALCSKLAHATGNPTLPMGVFAYHACSAGFELHRASLQFFAAAFSMLGVAECACSNVNAVRIDELSHRCFARIPDAYRATFDQHVQTHSFSHEVCMAQIATVEAELNNAPADFFLHVDRAIDALRGVPQQLAQYMRLPVFSEATCASYTTAVETSVMLPRPVAEFRRCGLTQSCVGRCTRAITPFFEAMARVEDGGGSPHRLPLQRDVDFPLRPWVSADAWHPVAVQLFARAGPRGCDYFKVVFAARAVDGGRDVEWRVSCLCFAKDTGVLRFELVHDIDVSHVLQNVRFRYAAAEARPTDVALTEAWILHPPQDSLARIVLFLSPAAGNNGVYEIVVPHAYTAEGVRAQWLLRARDALAPETCIFVPETVRRTLWSKGYFVDSVQLTFAPDADLELKQVVVLPRARSDDPSAYGVAARLRGTVMAGTQNYVFEIGLFVEAATCQGVKLHTDEDLPAHVRSLHAVFESLLQDETLLFAEREDGAVALVLYDKVQKQLHEHVVHVRVYSGETHNRLEMYLNRSDTHWRVASQGFQAVLDGMPKSVVSSSYRVSARYAQTAVYSRVLTRANNADHNWLLVATDTDRLTSSATWYNTYEFEPGAAPRQLLLRRQPLTQAVPTEVDRRCNYLDCTNCATNELQTLCFVAQRCVMARCVGAVVNTNNVFCAVGILLREVLVLQGSEDGSVYVGVVEVFTTIVRQYFSPQNGVNTVALQSISNLYTTIICDVKNVLAALSALLPAYFYTLASMVNALPAVGSAMLAGGNNAELHELVRVVSPRRQIEAATATFASTQLIFQVSLGLIFTLLRDLEIGMCLLSKYTETIATVHAQFVGPRISIVRNFAQFLYDENQGGDICEVLVQRDVGYASQRRTQAQEEAYIFELIRDGGAAAVSANNIATRGFDLQDITDSLSSLISAQVGLFRTYTKLKFSYFIKFLIGVTYGMTGVMIESQRDICTPQVQWSDAVLQCACGDAAYMVPPEHASASLGWCTGMLVLADEDGEEQTVHNPYSYAELVGYLGPHLRPLLAAINEHGQASAQARVLFAAMRASIPNLVRGLGSVPPVSVLMRCRDNYANKRWDRGAFELFAAGASPERTAAIEYVCAQHAAPGETPGVCGSPLANQALVCLHAGAGVNTIEACTQLVFPDLEAYFRYAPDPRASSAIPAGPDACRLATGSALQSSAALAPCMHHDTFASQCANSAADASTCDVNLAVHVHNGLIGILPADGYVIDAPAEQDPARVHARHRSLRDCILAKLVTDVSASITDQLTDFDLRVVSSEGDELHEVVDCSYLGGAASVDLLPNDPGAAVENMHFARPADPAACNGSAVTDRATGHMFREKTCGSPARVAVLTHIKHALTASNDNTIRSIVRSRLEDIVRNVSDLAMYACGDPAHPENVSIAACCPGGTCSADADYSPAVVTDTVIDFADIANSINFGGASSAHDVFTASMLDPEVRAPPLRAARRAAPRKSGCPTRCASPAGPAAAAAASRRSRACARGRARAAPRTFPRATSACSRTWPAARGRTRSGGTATWAETAPLAPARACRPPRARGEGALRRP